MLRLTTWNVNGLRASLNKGFPSFLQRSDPHVVHLQEVRALPDQLPPAWRAPEGFHATWHPAEKKGYSGVATWTRGPHEVLETGLPGEPDPEGRVLQTRCAGMRFVNVYLPSGSSGPERQAFKEAWMDRFLPMAAALAASAEPVVLTGDLNIAHTEDDIWNPVSNKETSGFLPHERAWFTRLLGTGWVDAQRAALGPGKGPYTWWSNRGAAREKDRGWRIDYVLVNAAAAPLVRAVTVDREAGITASDHAPVTVSFDVVPR